MKFMKLTILVIVVALASVAYTLVSPPPAAAATFAIGGFYGGCNNFSVDLALTGSTDDGGGLDIVRMKIVDGAGKQIYLEDARIKVGYTVGSLVVDLPYQSAPGSNPIRFSVIEINSGLSEVGELGAVTYNAPCMAGVGGTTRGGVYTPAICSWVRAVLTRWSIVPPTHSG